MFKDMEHTSWQQEVRSRQNLVKKTLAGAIYMHAKCDFVHFMLLILDFSIFSSINSNLSTTFIDKNTFRVLQNSHFDLFCSTNPADKLKIGLHFA